MGTGKLREGVFFRHGLISNLRNGKRRKAVNIFLPPSCKRFRKKSRKRNEKCNGPSRARTVKFLFFFFCNSFPERERFSASCISNSREVLLFWFPVSWKFWFFRSEKTNPTLRNATRHFSREIEFCVQRLLGEIWRRIADETAGKEGDLIFLFFYFPSRETACSVARHESRLGQKEEKIFF